MAIKITVVIELGSDNLLTRLSWRRRKAQVQKRDGGICQYCGKLAPDGTADHVIPLSRGGTDSLDNLAWACRSCNLSKGNRFLGTEWRKPLLEPLPSQDLSWLPDLDEG